MDTVRLECPMAVFERLHEAASGRGKKTEVLKRELSKLLVDHSRLIRACRRVGIEVKENE
jgi:hypothetical protein